MAEDKKPFGDTAFGKFVNEKIKPVAGNVLEVIGDLTGKDAISKIGEFLQDKSKEDTEEAGQFVALKQDFELQKMQFTLEHELEMAKVELRKHEIDAEVTKKDIEDLSNARQREIDFMKQSGGKRDWVQAGLAVFIMVITAYMIWFLSWYEVPPANENVFYTLLGTLVIGSFTGLREFFYGSSKGKREQDKVIHDFIKSKQNG